MKQLVSELANITGARLVGDGDVYVSGVATIDTAKPDDLVFAEDEKTLQSALNSAAGAVVAGEFAAGGGGKPLLIVRSPRLAFARAAAVLAPHRHHVPTVHSTAVLHHSVQVGKGVAIQANALLAEGVVVGDRTRVGPGTAIGENVVIGSNCDIAANVTIYPNVRIGNNVIIHAGAVLGADGFGYVRDSDTGKYEKFPQVGKLVIGNDVEIGANTTIDRGALGATTIGRGVKIDNLVHIGHNVQVGENVVIAAQTGISGSAVIERNAVIAGQVGIADHVRIEEGVILGAQCGVPTSKVVRGKGVVFWGTPARPIRGYLKELAVLAKLAKK